MLPWLWYLSVNCFVVFYVIPLLLVSRSCTIVALLKADCTRAISKGKKCLYAEHLLSLPISVGVHSASTKVFVVSWLIFFIFSFYMKYILFFSLHCICRSYSMVQGFTVRSCVLEFWCFWCIWNTQFLRFVTFCRYSIAEKTLFFFHIYKTHDCPKFSPVSSVIPQLPFT